MTRIDYIAGKMAILATFLLFVTWVPAMLLLIGQILLSGSFEFARANIILFPAITVFSFLEVFIVCCAVLALSSLTTSTRYVAVMFAGVMFFSEAIYGTLRMVTGSTAVSWVSFTGSLAQVGDAIFRQPLRYTTPVAVSFIVLAGAGGGVALGARTPGSRRGGGGVSAPIVTTEHLSKWYGQVSGLNDVTVAVPPGITGLLGPNGAGKSTFLKLITGQLKPSKGTVTVLGQPIWDNPGAYFKIGFCPEQDAFYERMTGLAWVTALVRLNGYEEAEAAAAAEKAIAAVDLLDAKDKKIGAYSKGMRQRIKMAQALVHDPGLLILDEPLTGMDPLMRRRTIKLIKEWARQGKSIIVSSHILHEVESMTSNILLINNGRILAEGNVHQIRDLIDTHPHTVFVRAEQPRAFARHCLAYDDVLSLRFESGAVVVQTGKPDVFYARMTSLAATDEVGLIHEVTSPDDNLQAVFQYLVK